jgi:hypothetical protein
MESQQVPQLRSKNIALNDFHRETGDEIVQVIGKELKEYLVRKLKDNETLEIEAKIGVIMPAKDIDPSEPFYSIFYTPHGLIMPDQKWNGRNLYYFNPGVSKEKFDLLIQIFSKECERRLASVPTDVDEKQIGHYKQEYCIKDLGERKTIDRMFSDGVRSTYSSTNELIENLKKHKYKHINYFNKGRDYRISISVEEKCEGTTSHKITNTRHKRRRSFQFKWMKFEFTETVEENFKGEKALPVYEIELEICDNKFFNQPHLEVYMRLVERFIHNIDSLIVALNEGEELFFDTFCKPEFDNCYKEQYGEVLPVVGDYLSIKAFDNKII